MPVDGRNSHAGQLKRAFSAHDAMRSATLAGVLAHSSRAFRVPSDDRAKSSSIEISFESTFAMALSNAEAAMVHGRLHEGHRRLVEATRKVPQRKKPLSEHLGHVLEDAGLPVLDREPTPT